MKPTILTINGGSLSFKFTFYNQGIGENRPVLRKRICEGPGFPGIALDELSTAKSAAVIASDAERTAVRVISADEELMIARSACRALSLR